MEQQIFQSYFAIIPANVRYDKELNANAKLLYGELTALSNAQGYCWATNSYFANLYSVSTKSISRWISTLEKRGYIKTKYLYKQGTKEIKERHIFISAPSAPMDKNVQTYGQKCPAPMDKNVQTYGQKCPAPMDKNVQDNNTVNNTLNSTINNSRKKTFDPSSTEYKLSNFLYEKIKENDNEAKIPNLQKWSIHIDRLIRLDNRTVEEIKNVIIFAQNNKFWKSNILSTKKLRNKFQTLKIQMEGEKQNGEIQLNGTSVPKHKRHLEEWQKRQIETSERFIDKEIEEVDF